MKEIKVLGSGCAACRRTTEMIARAAEEQGVQIRLDKVEDLQAIMDYNILSTPGVVVDGEVVHTGGIPSMAQVRGWLEHE